MQSTSSVYMATSRCSILFFRLSVSMITSFYSFLSLYIVMNPQVSMTTNFKDSFTISLYRFQSVSMASCQQCLVTPWQRIFPAFCLHGNTFVRLSFSEAECAELSKLKFFTLKFTMHILAWHLAAKFCNSLDICFNRIIQSVNCAVLFLCRSLVSIRIW